MDLTALKENCYRCNVKLKKPQRMLMAICRKCSRKQHKEFEAISSKAHEETRRQIDAMNKAVKDTCRKYKKEQKLQELQAEKFNYDFKNQLKGFAVGVIITVGLVSLMFFFGCKVFHHEQKAEKNLPTTAKAN